MYPILDGNRKTVVTEFGQFFGMSFDDIARDVFGRIINEIMKNFFDKLFVAIHCIQAAYDQNKQIQEKREVIITDVNLPRAAVG